MHKYISDYEKTGKRDLTNVELKRLIFKIFRFYSDFEREAHKYDIIANNIQNRMTSISPPSPQFNSNKLVSIYHVIIIIIKSLHFTPAVLISISGLQQVEIITFLVTLCRRCFSNTYACTIKWCNFCVSHPFALSSAVSTEIHIKLLISITDVVTKCQVSRTALMFNFLQKRLETIYFAEPHLRECL